MSVSLTGVRNQCMSLTNASTVYGTLNSDLFNTSEFDESALTRDLQVCEAILTTPDHHHLAAFTASTASGVATGTIVVDHVGPIFNVKRTRTDSSVVLAELRPYPSVARWQRNDSALYATANLKERYFALAHGQVHFPGGGTISYQYRTLTKGANPQAPDEFTATIAMGVLGDLFSKEGLSEAMSASCHKQFNDNVERIRQRLTPLPVELAA